MTKNNRGIFPTILTTTWDPYSRPVTGSSKPMIIEDNDAVSYVPNGRRQ